MSKLTQSAAINLSYGGIDLSKFTSIDKDAAETLTMGWEDLNFYNLKELKPAIAEILSKHRAKLLFGITKISKEAAAALKAYTGTLSLPDITHVDIDVAKELSEGSYSLSMSDLQELGDTPAELALFRKLLPAYSPKFKKISAKQAEILLEKEKEIRLEYLRELSPEAAEVLSNYDKKIHLEIPTISGEAAHKLSAHTGELFFSVKTLDDEAALGLGNHVGTLSTWFKDLKEGTGYEALARKMTSENGINWLGEVDLSHSAAQGFSSSRFPINIELKDFEFSPSFKALLETMVKNNGEIKLAITQLSRKIAEILQNFEGKLLLPKVKNFDDSPEQVAVLKKVLKNDGTEWDNPLRNVEFVGPECAEIIAEELKDPRTSNWKFKPLDLPNSPGHIEIAKKIREYYSPTHLCKETAEILKSNYVKIGTDKLKEINEEIASIIIPDGGSCAFNELESIDAGSARIIAERSKSVGFSKIEEVPEEVAGILGAKEELSISFSNLKKANLWVLRKLSKPKGYLNLGLEEIDGEKAEILAEHEGLLELKLTKISNEVARILASGKATRINLHKIEEIEDDAASSLSKFPNDLNMHGLTKLPETPGRLELLAKLVKEHGIDTKSFKIATGALVTAVKGDGDYINLESLEYMSPDVAKALSEYTGNITLSKLKEIDDESAEELTNFKGKFFGYSLNNISNKAMKAIAQGATHVVLAIESIDAEGAAALCGAKEVSIDRVKSMDDETCAVFSKYKGKLNIEGIRNVSKEGGRNLLKLKKRLYTTKAGYYAIA
jgi:sulfur relay (sulfurtransferase) DsrC/TusE family protein